MSLSWLPVLLLAAVPDGTVVKAVLDTAQSGENVLRLDRFGSFERGFVRDGAAFVCDNGADAAAVRGVTQSIQLNQKRPEPIIATAWSKAEGVSGSPNSDYALYLDLVYDDGTPLWGQSASFSTGTHDWQKRQVVVLPEKPVKQLSFHLLMRRHSGKALFRDPELRLVRAPAGSHVFDGVPVSTVAKGAAFQVRDVAAGSGFVAIEKSALGLNLDVRTTSYPRGNLFSATLRNTTGKDRAVTLLYALPVPAQAEVPITDAGGKAERQTRRTVWMEDPRHSVEAAAGREYARVAHFPCGANGRLSLYPLAAVKNAADGRGVALGIDLRRPAFFRLGYHAGTGELFLAYDLALTAEKPEVTLDFCSFAFDASQGFRGALAGYYAIYADAFRCRTPRQGLWMPFAKISLLANWEDFGFKFKEGNDETAWDDAHGIITFRYTEPMTWWMTMPKQMPRTYDAALAEARRLADKGSREAQSLFTSGYHNAEGRFAARLLDTPWCNGAVWSMNSMPGIAGEVTDFNVKWNAKLRQKLYPNPQSGLDGEYIDSSEGYVTDVLDFRREHFAAAATPLVFSTDTHRPAIFRGLVAYEYVRGIADDVHAMGKLMMANGAPSQLCWLVPLIDVAGTETDWHWGDKWRPMSDAELLYRRAMCKGKPYCFLMNTAFEKFGPELVEKYMKRSLAYGMFPGFFSHNASEGHYFTRPELYNRDRPLFKKYVPLCTRVAEAGWEPLTGARSSDARVHVERFGDRPRYLTVFNDSPERRTATITLDAAAPASTRELVRGGTVTWNGNQAAITLESEDVAVVEIP